MLAELLFSTLPLLPQAGSIKRTSYEDCRKKLQELDTPVSFEKLSFHGGCVWYVYYNTQVVMCCYDKPYGTLRIFLRKPETYAFLNSFLQLCFNNQVIDVPVIIRDYITKDGDTWKYTKETELHIDNGQVTLVDAQKVTLLPPPPPVSLLSFI